jgi:hypothetical protein
MDRVRNSNACLQAAHTKIEGCIFPSGRKKEHFILKRGSLTYPFYSLPFPLQKKEKKGHYDI